MQREFCRALENRRARRRQFGYWKVVRPAILPSNIALIGFMGTGKSSVGRMVATLLQFRFIDTDEFIEEQTEMARWKDTVVATGGGLAAQRGNLDALKQCAYTVCLWASPEAIWERVKHQTHRPLLHDPDPLGKIRTLLAQREPFYRKADLLITTEQRPIRQIAQQVVHEYQAQASRGFAP